MIKTNYLFNYRNTEYIHVVHTYTHLAAGVKEREGRIPRLLIKVINVMMMMACSSLRYWSKLDLSSKFNVINVIVINYVNNNKLL